MRHKILIIDDEQVVLKSNRKLLEKNGFEVDTVLGGDQGIKKISENKDRYSLILLDYHMPGKNGLLTLKEILQINPEQLVVMFSSDDSSSVHSETVGNGGAYSFVDKDIKSTRLLNIVKSLCEKSAQNKKILEVTVDPSALEQNINSVGLIGCSPSFSKTVDEIKKFAPTNSTVLIRGETGVGKSLIAQAIHNLSSRRDQPFVAFNCANLHDGLLQSQLFGHLKGSFTGAFKDQDGLFKEADGGTIFLDEIGEMDMETQAKLLRVLEDKIVKPLGGKEFKVDVRIIAATHLDFSKALNKTFREDLYYRLNVLNLTIAPLRKRKEDIEPLIAYFTKKYNAKNGTDKHFLQRTAYLMSGMEWRGNIRELQNFVERNLSIVDGNTIAPIQLKDENNKSIYTVESANKEIKSMQELMKRQDEEQRQYVMENFTLCDSLYEAAEKENLPYTSARRLLERLGIENLFSKTKTVKPKGEKHETL